METLILFFELFQVILIFLMILVLAYLAMVMISFKNLIPFVPTPKKMAREMADFAELKESEVVCDIGSGTGKLLISLAKKYPKNKLVGFEKSRLLRILCKLKLKFFIPRNKNIKIINQDIFTVDYSKYNVAVMFLVPEALEKLKPRFDQMEAGSKVISYMFYFEHGDEWAEKVHHYSERESIYVYTKLF